MNGRAQEWCQQEQKLEFVLQHDGHRVGEQMLDQILFVVIFNV